ncbi:hypothetical protein ASPZODRAFT_150730 [Penicilliopsis zonata CBS 506.65]|uniref:Uncharacterized protein n=1 Tax=Penicilliopsis zonata CBS 506.65 TaxID=1073090 RepID=A0A1L9SMU9_9EURO|nr:hypothetical protein ASPZODRAFT_150730 [Penicilliopsis zonata CBS 506.65]OJJ48518.1 hypothetical protein ASPZODRAFT_150730 [Penicilliopsis zonata CBS 506.65]
MALAIALAPKAWAELVNFELDLTWEDGAPNGETRKMVFMNGQFPGPELRINQGDEVEFVVHNNMPFNASIHFHGVEMLNTPWSDGVPGLSQKPILPGDSFTYKWTATQYGVYWYHSHDRGTMFDGLYGAIQINPAPGTPAPWDLISQDKTDIKNLEKAELNTNLVVLSDWDHLTSEEYQNLQVESGLDLFCVDSVLINGKGAIYCPGSEEIASLETSYLKASIANQPLSDKGCYPNIYKTQGNFSHDESVIPDGLNSGCVASAGFQEVLEVDPADGWASFKFIGATTLKSLVVSIDEHPMWVYEVDGHYIEPRKVDEFSIFNGERFSVMIKLDKTPRDYTIRVPDTNGDQIIAGFAKMKYKGGQDLGDSKPYVTYGGTNTSADVVALNLTRLPPYPRIEIPRTADQLVNLTFGRMGSSYQWTLEGHALYNISANLDSPILFDVESRKNLPEQVTIETKNGTWVDLLLQAGSMPNTPDIQAPHVIHKHSNKAFIIGFGDGYFNWSSVEEAIEQSPQNFELEHPQYRDTFVTNSPNGPTWLLVRYQVVNPGPFLLHCHIETHLLNGMGVALLDGTDVWPEVPQEYAI